MCMKHIFPMGFYFSIMLITYSAILRIGRTNRWLRYEQQFSWFIRQSRQKHMKPVLAIDERKNIDYFLHFLVRLGNINIFVKVWFGVWHYHQDPLIVLRDGPRLTRALSSHKMIFVTCILLNYFFTYILRNSMHEMNP
jgi:amino acid permease